MHDIEKTQGFDPQGSTGVILIGSGPSLAKVDIGALKNYPTIAFNRSYIAYDDWGFAPTYYACIDHIALRDNLPEIQALAQDSRIDKLFIRDSARDLGLRPTPRISFLTLTNEFKFSTNLQELGMFNNVAATSIQVLASLGYRRILMLGIDASFQHHATAEVVDKAYHLRATGDDDPNHFRPDYYGKGREFTRPNAEKLNLGWQELANTLPDTVEVRNATIGSALTCFPKTSLANGLNWITQGE